MPWLRSILISAESTKRGNKLFANFVNSSGHRHIALAYHMSWDAEPLFLAEVESFKATTNTHSPVCICAASTSLEHAHRPVVKRSIASRVVIGMGVMLFFQLFINAWNVIGPVRLVSSPKSMHVWVLKCITLRTTHSPGFLRVDKTAGIAFGYYSCIAMFENTCINSTWTKIALTSMSEQYYFRKSHCGWTIVPVSSGVSCRKDK